MVLKARFLIFQLFGQWAKVGQTKGKEKSKSNKRLSLGKEKANTLLVGYLCSAKKIDFGDRVFCWVKYLISVGKDSGCFVGSAIVSS